MIASWTTMLQFMCFLSHTCKFMAKSNREVGLTCRSTQSQDSAVA